MAGTAGSANIPSVDLGRAFTPIRGEIRAAIDAVLDKQDLILGEEVEQFERDFAAYCGAEHCVSVHSGTAALHLALLASGIGAGDEVITQPNTYFGTVAAILYTGATPVFADIAAPSYTIDPHAVEAAITAKTRAVVGVHLFGQPFALDEIARLAADRGLLLFEDAAQAHGAEYRRKRIGARRDSIATFSFYPTKNLGALGEGGCILTADEALAAHLRRLRNHGSQRKFYHTEVGYNARLDTLQAAVLSVKLRHLDEWVRARRHIANLYDRALPPNAQRPLVPEDVKHAYYLYPVVIENRDAVRNHLLDLGIETAIHYPVPCHLQEALASLGYRKGSFPNAERLAQHELSLPMFPGLQEKEVERIADATARSLSQR